MTNRTCRYRGLVRLPGRMLLLFVPAMFAVVACSTSVSLKVDTSVPQPLIDPREMRIGAYYESAFRNHIYVENTDDRPNWNIETGSSQVALFDQLLGSSFVTVIPMDHVYDGITRVDAVIAPKIEEIQLATPRETLQEFYEAWIKYNVSLYDSDGNLVVIWPMTAYGRTRSGRFTSDETGLNGAIESALRDAGAKFTIGFFEDPGVKQWFAQH